MATLSAWQRIDRVLPGQPNGDGFHGSATVASDPNTRATFTGTATQVTGTAGSTAFSNGDLVKITQTQGTGAGQYEYNLVISGGGTTSLTFSTALHNTYTTGAQIIKIPRYTTATVTAHSVTAWNGSTGGDEIILAKNSITVSGSLNGAGLGFVGGAAVSGSGNNTGKQGESYVDNPQAVSTSANEDGGGGGAAFGGGSGSGGGGGSGGHASTGTNGHIGNNGESGGSAGGAATDSADGTSMQFGGGGGSGSSRSVGGGTSGKGGNGGAIVTLISDTITLSSTVTVAGEGGSTGSQGGLAAGGGGAGGFILGICRTASLGTNNLVATGGVGTSGNGGDGASFDGSVGRIAIHHSGSVTGTTNPTFTDVSDPTLIESSGGSFIFNLI